MAHLRLPIWRLLLPEGQRNLAVSQAPGIGSQAAWTVKTVENPSKGPLNTVWGWEFLIPAAYTGRWR